MRNIKLPNDYIVYSNNSNPYYKSMPDTKNDIQITPSNAFELCSAIEKINCTGDSFCSTIEKKIVRFWFNWN